MKLWALTVGNILEWYDYAIYGSLAPVIATVFFPNYAPTTAILLTLTVFAIGFICRPLGAIIFGYIGDKKGRKPAFLLSILLMVFPTLLISILPTYRYASYLAPLLLMICRLLQGIAIGGEYPVAATYIYETVSFNRRGFYGSLLNVSTVVGVIFATLVVVVLNHIFSSEQMKMFGWRIAFLVTAITAIFSFYLRFKLIETPEFVAISALKRSHTPVLEVIKKNKKIVIWLFLYLICAAVAYYSYNVYTVSFLKTQAHFSYDRALLISLFSSVLLALFIPFFGMISDRIGRKFVTIISLFCFLILSRFLYALILSGNMIEVLIAQFIFAIILAMYLGTLPSYICEKSGTGLRVSTIAIGYNLSLTIFGGTAPMVNVYLIHIYKSAYAPSYYLILAALVSLLTVLFVKVDTND